MNPSPLNQQAYTQLKQRLLMCDYLPGSTLNEKALMEALHFGRTPIREALLQLQSEGYLTIIPRKNILVNPITFSTVHQLYQYRRLIDPAIACEFKASYQPEQLIEHLRQFKAMDTTPDTAALFYQQDINFHLDLISVSQNQLLINDYKALMERQLQIGMYTYRLGKNNDLQATIQEHQAIIESLLSQNEEDIRHTILLHIQQSMRSALNALQ